MRKVSLIAVFLTELFSSSCIINSNEPTTPVLEAACNVTTKAKTRNSITAHWPKAGGDSGNTFKYSVYYSSISSLDTLDLINGFGIKSLNSKSETYEWEITGLAPLTTYYVNVTVVGTSGKVLPYCQLQDQTFP